LDGTGPQRADQERQEATWPAKSAHRQTDEARAERRRRDRERLQRAARELLSSDGWARWVKTRAMFHSYSAGNCMLLAAQGHQRGIALTRVAGFRTWLKLGRSVRKGETALRILAPVPVKKRDKLTDGDSDERRVFFKTAFVLDVSQTDMLPGAEQVSLEPPHEPLSGDSHAHLLAPMCEFAASLGYMVSFEVIDGSAGGWCDPKAKRIVIDAGVPANAQLRTLIHECAHASGIDYELYSRAQAEVMVDTIAFSPRRSDPRSGCWAECGWRVSPTAVGGYWMWPASRSASSSSPVVKTSTPAVVRSLSWDQTGRLRVSASATVGQSSGSRAAMRCSA
jgi:hypothetical protein